MLIGYRQLVFVACRPTWSVAYIVDIGQALLWADRYCLRSPYVHAYTRAHTDHLTGDCPLIGLAATTGVNFAVDRGTHLQNLGKCYQCKSSPGFCHILPLQRIRDILPMYYISLRFTDLLTYFGQVVPLPVRNK